MPFILTIIDYCPTTTLVLNSPFVDTTYVLGDPQKDITWASDAALGKVAIDPRTCGSFAVAFWLVDGSNNPIQDLTTITSLLLNVNSATRTISVLATNSVASVGVYRIAYKISVPSYPTILVA